MSLAQENNKEDKIASLEAKINEMQLKYEGQISIILEQYDETQRQLESALTMIEELKKESTEGKGVAARSLEERGAADLPPPDDEGFDFSFLPAQEEGAQPSEVPVSVPAGEGGEEQVAAVKPLGEEGPGGFDYTELLFDEIKLGPVEWHGRIESRYIDIKSIRNVDNIDKLSSFAQSTFALWAGMDITKDIEVNAELEFEPTEESSNEIRLDQARITWDLIKPPPTTKLSPGYESSWGLVEEGILSFTFGKFYYPFGIERFSYSGPVNKLVDRPSPFRIIIPGTYSDVGVKLHGLVPIRNSLAVRYEIAVTNGLRGPLTAIYREDRQNTDRNRNKQVGGRVGLSMTDWFEIGGSFITGKYHTGNTSLQPDDESLFYYGADARVSYNKIKLLSSTTEEIIDLRGEYVFNHVNQPPHQLPKKRDLDFSREGWYVQAAYKFEFHKPFLNYIEPVFRFDSLDDDVAKFASLSGDFENPVRALNRWDPVLEVNRYAFGIGWSPFKHFRIKGEYEISDETMDVPDGANVPSEYNNNAFLFEMSIDW